MSVMERSGHRFKTWQVLETSSFYLPRKGEGARSVPFTLKILAVEEGIKKSISKRFYM